MKDGARPPAIPWVSSLWNWTREETTHCELGAFEASKWRCGTRMGNTQDLELRGDPHLGFITLTAMGGPSRKYRERPPREQLE